MRCLVAIDPGKVGFKPIERERHARGAEWIAQVQGSLSDPESWEKDVDLAVGHVRNAIMEHPRGPSVALLRGIVHEPQRDAASSSEHR